MVDPKDTGKRGFGSMDEERQREIAAKGGRSAHEKGTAHEFSSDEASAAGRRAHESGKAHEFSSEEARQAGAKGGQSSRGSQRGGSAEQHAKAGRQSHKNT